MLPLRRIAVAGAAWEVQVAISAEASTELAHPAVPRGRPAAPRHCLIMRVYRPW
jgi:hypothetical protein